jgi:hypothetical protein
LPGCEEETPVSTMALAASITLSGCEEETLTSQTPKTEIEWTVTLNPRTAALNPQRTAPNLQRAAPNRRRTALNQQSAVENKQTAPTPTPRPRIASDEKAVDVVEGASEADERAADVGDQQPDVDQQAPIADPFANANPILDDYEFNGTVLAARRWHGLLWAWRRISWWTGLIFLSPAVIASVKREGVRSFSDVFPIPIRAYLAQDAILIINDRFDILFVIGFMCWLAVVPLRVASAVIEEHTSIKVQENTSLELGLKHLPGLQPLAAFTTLNGSSSRFSRSSSSQWPSSVRFSCQGIYIFLPSRAS